MKKTALIMAGGRGERFWPRSRKSCPKQFLSLTEDKKTMLQLTVERIGQLVEIEDIYIATNLDYKELVLGQLPGLPEENVLCEPVGRNTAPCIGLAAAVMQKKYGDAVMIVLPSDHLIQGKAMFIDTLDEACSVAEAGLNLVTLGITPDAPETGYGYIKFNRNEPLGKAFAVEEFVEKPNLETAKEYLSSGQYLWNSGMFAWKVSSILENIKEHLPELYFGLSKISEAIGTEDEKPTLLREFAAFQSVSIDYGVMERARNIYTIPGAFGWDDVGSWLAVSRIRSSDELGNVVSGKVVAVDTRNSIIQGEDKLIALVGLSDVIVVDTQDALLVCKKESAGKIKDVLERLRQSGQEQYL